MPDLRTLRNEAKRLIRQGEAAYKKHCEWGEYGTLTAVNRRTGEVTRTKFKRRPPQEDEYELVYQRARDLLLKHGYEKELNPKVQSLYFELIPDSQQFLEEKKATLQPLRSRSPDKRLKAASAIDNHARAAFRLQQWLRHPHTTEAIIEANRRETTPRVIETLVRSMGAIYNAYFADLRLVPEVVAAFESDEKRVVDTAIVWSSGMNSPEAWSHILDLLSKRVPQARLRLLLVHASRAKGVRIKRKLVPLLISHWGSKLNGETKANLAGTLLNLADERFVDEIAEQIVGMRGLKSELRRRAVYETEKRERFLRERLSL